MDEVTLDIVTAARELGWRLHGTGADLPPLSGAVISTRDLQTSAAQLFVALQGTTTHGAVFAAQAAGRAPALLLGSDTPPGLVREAVSAHPFVIEAPSDGVTALGELARWWRRRAGFAVVGVTGSSGKTSTKDLLGAVLGARRSVVRSHANWNNEIGVPLTLLNAPAASDVVVCEMGMRGLGQIRYLCEVALPDVGIVTNAGTAHLELLGSRRNIAIAKAELLASVSVSGIGVAPADQPELAGFGGIGQDRLRTFGPEADAFCRLLEAERTERGIRGELEMGGLRKPFDLPVHGLHQARNLAAALCGASALLTPEELETLDLATLDAAVTEGRGGRFRTSEDALVIDDAYNANPESMRAAVSELEAVDARRRVAVLGCMAELGDAAGQLHRQLGELVADSTVDELVVIDTAPEAREYASAWAAVRGIDARVFADPDQALRARGEWLRPGDAVLVKASNSVGLGALVAGLRAGVSKHDGDPADAV